jgi:hypothetical protein
MPTRPTHLLRKVRTFALSGMMELYMSWKAIANFRAFQPL